MNGYTPKKGKYTYWWGLNCERVIATVERSAGNETIGDRWIETKSFPAETTIHEIMDWAGKIGITGKLYITPDLATERDEEKPNM